LPKCSFLLELISILLFAFHYRMHGPENPVDFQNVTKSIQFGHKETLFPKDSAFCSFCPDLPAPVHDEKEP